MPRNDRSDSLSVRGEDDPRRLMKGMQQETELELGRAESGQTGGVEHQSARERDGQALREPPRDRPSAPVAGPASDAPGGDERP